MKIKQFAITLVASLFLLVSCKKDPSQPAASFTYSGAGVAPASVTFTNASLNAVSYSWDFGDNGNSIEESPTHIYTKGGVYTVKLTATGKGGSNSITKTVNIQSPTSVKITTVKLLGMPMTNSVGEEWDDNGTGPDPNFSLIGLGNELLTGTTFNNISSIPSQGLIWNITPAYQITNFSATYTLAIWDVEDSPFASVLMGAYSFTFSDIAARGYPATIVIQADGSPLSIELTLQWQ